ncbi:MAG: 4-hydroxy-tetrahydrodipicolinate reductase [Clostridiales bacterium]|nr:MAG: 4-hydroxy-tetrahydrodipicolinate reductase [Clostridiales bacterium]
MKKILITGACGFMGKMIRECAKAFDDIEIIAGVDIAGDGEGLTIYRSLENVTFAVDCLIDFSHPSLFDDVLTYATKYKVPTVVATTGLSKEAYKRMDVAADNIPLFVSANMSLGINLICELLKKAVPTLYKTYDIEIVEKHHNRKLDAPSGTAIMLADAASKSVDEEFDYIYDRHSVRQKRNKMDIGFSSVRGGTIVGEHDVIFAGDDEIITISHSAMSRRIFANGALEAARFISEKRTGIYSMEDLIKERLENK